MAVYRQIQITFWQDKFVLSLTPEKKFFYMYLLTNSKTKQCGIYELPIKIASLETGYDNETIQKLFIEFEEFGKILYDYDSGEIAIRNWRKYNETTSPKTLSCIRKELIDVKSKRLLEFMEYQEPTDLTKAHKNYRVSEKTREFILNRDNRECTKCHSKEDLTVDHIYPRSLGGLSDIENLRTLCRSCNSKRPLLGEDLIKEITDSGYDYNELKKTYQYPIGGGSQKEKEKKEEETQEEKIRTLWARTFGRTPKLPEYEETEKLLLKFGNEKLYRIYKEATLKGFKNLGTLIDQLDEEGNIKPRNGQEIKKTPEPQMSKELQELKEIDRKRNGH